jgi:GT2 family glycosyltransferase
MTEDLTAAAAITLDSRGTLARRATDRAAVIIVNFNSGDHLRACLRAIARQSVRPHRVVVVDNGSGDDSLGRAEGIYPDVEIIRIGSNLGFAAANNMAIRLVDDCHFVALVNADAYVQADWLEQLLAAAAANSDCHLFSCRLVSAADPGRLDGTGDVYHVSGRAWRRDWGSPIAASGSSTPTIGACAAAALYLREAVLDAGGFDEDYFCFYEDVDLSFRLQLLGHPGRYVPAAIARHVGSASTIRRSDFCVYHAHRNLVWTYVKNMPAPLFWLYLPQHIALNLATILWFAAQGRGRVILRAKWDALRGLRRAWQKRREIQSRRKVSVRKIQSLLARGLPRP